MPHLKYVADLYSRGHGQGPSAVTPKRVSPRTNLKAAEPLIPFSLWMTVEVT